MIRSTIAHARRILSDPRAAANAAREHVAGVISPESTHAKRLLARTASDRDAWSAAARNRKATIDDLTRKHADTCATRDRWIEIARLRALDAETAQRERDALREAVRAWWAAPLGTAEEAETTVAMLQAAGIDPEAAGDALPIELCASCGSVAPDGTGAAGLRCSRPEGHDDEGHAASDERGCQQTWPVEIADARAEYLRRVATGEP